MSDVYLTNLGIYSLPLIVGVTSISELGKMKLVPLDQLIAQNTIITNLTVEKIEKNDKDAYMLLLRGLEYNTTLKLLVLPNTTYDYPLPSGHLTKLIINYDSCDNTVKNLVRMLQSNSTLKSLEINGLPEEGKSAIYAYISQCNLKELQLNLHMNLSTYFGCMDAIYNNTSLTSIRCLCYRYQVHNSYLPVSGKNILIVASNKTNIRRLDTASSLLQYLNFSNTTLETLNVLGSVSTTMINKILKNTSITEYSAFEISETYKDDINKWLLRNRELRWKFIHNKIMDMYIAMSSLRIPPYVLLEIFDWLYPDNPYTRHYVKIKLLISLTGSYNAIFNKDRSK